jgi:hypothetical protein
VSPARRPARRASDGEAERAVRAYLLYLEDPARLVDGEEVDRLEALVAGADDPIVKLRAVADLARARTVDGAALRDAFVAHALPWAQTNDVPEDAFRALGVPEQDLVDAGLAGEQRGPSAPVDLPPMTVAAIIAHVAGRAGDFTLADVRAATGASAMTVRKAVKVMLEAREIELLGPDRTHDGPGRAPMLYRRVPGSVSRRRRPRAGR